MSPFQARKGTQKNLKSLQAGKGFTIAEVWKDLLKCFPKLVD